MGAGLLRRQGLRNLQGHSNYWIGLEDEKYDKVKRIWNRLSQEIDRLYNQERRNQKPMTTTTVLIPDY